MGVIYRAYDQRLLRWVALKMVRDDIAADPVWRSRILEEARAACALSHPAITTIYEVGDGGDGLFIVMELVAGQTLRGTLTGPRVDTRTLLSIGIQIAEALAAAHDCGVIHRDIKPENVMVLPDGRVKLLDFGIARRTTVVDTEAFTRGLTDPAAASETVGTIGQAGTLAYMAPELFAGERADARSDLFSLGVLLYESVAGRRPFSDSSRAFTPDDSATLAAPLESVAPEAPSGLSDVVHKLLERDPSRRTQTAREVASQLNAVLRDVELRAMLPPAMAGRRAVAVLPFRLLSPDPSDAYLSGALTDAVINRLSDGGELLVRPTSAVMRYANQALDSLVAGRELNVSIVIDGSVQRHDRRLRVHVQARSVRDGTTLTSARHEADVVDLFGLQDEVADGLRRALGVQLVPEAGRLSTNAKAGELFLRASERLVAMNRWDMRSAIDMLEDATRLDPEFADAWARLGEACVLMQQMYEPDGKWLPVAQRAIRRALALNPDNALAYSARARAHWMPATGFNVRSALRATTTALRLNPGCQPAWVWQGAIFYHIGLQDDARASLMAALASNPNDPFSLSFLAQTFFETRDYDRARSFTERALAIDRAGLYANLFRPMASIYDGRLDDANRHVREARLAVGSDPMLFGYDALLHAKDGRAAKARTAIKKAAQGKSLVHGHHTYHLVAAAAAVLGDARASVTALRKAARSGLPNYSGFRDDPHFESLHRHKPFLELMSALKRETAAYRREFSAHLQPSPGA